jgi:tripartite-type tricarboxylate transporter receptor subunit TctC
MRILWLALAMGTGSAFAQAPAYPVKPVRFIAGFPAGGPSDIVTRAVAKRMSELLGQPDLVRRGGAGRHHADIVTRLNTTLVKIVGEKETQSFLAPQGLEPEASTPDELGRIIAAEIPKFARIVKAAGIKPE